MIKGHIKSVAYICSQKGMDCTGARGCGKSCFHTLCPECAADPESVKMVEEFFNKFDIDIRLYPLAKTEEGLFEIYLTERKRND